MSTKTVGVVGRGSGWQKVGIRLGYGEFYPNFIPTGPVPKFWSYTKGKNLTTMLSEFLFLDMPILVKVFNINSQEYEIGHNAGKDEKHFFSLKYTTN